MTDTLVVSLFKLRLVVARVGEMDRSKCHCPVGLCGRQTVAAVRTEWPRSPSGFWDCKDSRGVAGKFGDLRQKRSGVRSPAALALSACL